MDLSFNCPFLSGWRLLTVVKENWSLVCVFFWRLGVTQCLPMMKPMMYPLSQSLIGFYKRWVFFAWHLWAKVELSKNVGWKPQGGWTCIQLYFFLFVSADSHVFFSMLGWLFTLVWHWYWQDSPHHLSTLHISWFFIWFISLSVAFSFCFLPLLSPMASVAEG